ncbi:hydrogenase [Desulforamulus aquiferis]|uniref:Hydrogenase n=1 Tax=Desulforamulus aquiferis TaxID=1397668 RepID=A0AAW7ZEA0_9FIRM|nr:hydrogenase [Desulforamulus aquiferis]MDO7787584.1 hydrogenase [Desulforamulus aquiferis]RYD01437.1 hydrogenase [Desulforamulus aquiferis]
MTLLTILLLAGAVLLTRVSCLRTAIGILGFQSVIVALACSIIGINTGEFHMYIAAALTVIIKVGLIPYALWKVASQLKQEREIANFNISFLLAILVIIASYGFVGRELPLVSGETLAAAVAITAIGLLMIMTRRQAILQVVGLITMENGLYLLGLSITRGLPLIIELGIFFDVLVAVVILVILAQRLKHSFETTDTSILNELKG